MFIGTYVIAMISVHNLTVIIGCNGSKSNLMEFENCYIKRPLYLFYTSIFLTICLDTHMHAHKHACACMHANTHTYMNTHTQTHIHRHPHTHTYTHMLIHTNTHVLLSTY